MATKWGCIGPGKISSDFFLSIQDNLPKSEHKFVAVASRDLTKAQKFADKFKFQKTYDSYDELAADPDVEVVYIGTIHINHDQLSVKMLEAGKHVICEKPMGMNSKQVKRVLQVAKDKQRLFIEASWSRWLPAYGKVREELSNGTLGEIKLVQANFCQPIFGVERFKNLELGGGGMLDIGIYVVQFACLVYGEMPESITAVGNMLNGVDESACITLKYKNGGMASLVYNGNVPSTVNNAVILGTKGQIVLESPFWSPTQVTTPSGSFEFPLKDNNYFFTNSAGLQYEAAGTRECLLNGWLESPMFKHSDSEMVHQIMDEVRRQIGMKYPAYD